MFNIAHQLITGFSNPVQETTHLRLYIHQLNSGFTYYTQGLWGTKGEKESHLIFQQKTYRSLRLVWLRLEDGRYQGGLLRRERRRENGAVLGAQVRVSAW